MIVNRGPWRVRESAIEGQIAITHRTAEGSEVIASETRADLELLRDALTEYLTATAPPAEPEDVEYAVCVWHEADGEPRIGVQSTLAMAKNLRDQYRTAYAEGGSCLADAHVVVRTDSGPWVTLGDPDIERIQRGAWEALDAALAPVVARGLAQLAAAERERPEGVES